MTKTCTKCGVAKPLDAFYKRSEVRRILHSSGAFSVDSRCKNCACLYAKERHVVKKDYNAAQKRKYYQSNRERFLEKAKEWQRQNLNRAKANRSAYYEKNKEKILANTLAWRKAHPERAAAFTWSNKAKRRFAFIEHVDPAVVYERDMGLCQICGLPIENDDFHLDHRIPFAHGGQHSYENCQSAHAVCNRRKHTTLPEDCAHLWRRS